MKKEIKVNYLDEQIDNLQNEYEEYTQQETEEVKEKTIKEINITSTKTALVLSWILFLWLFAGMFIMSASQDTTIQDNIQKIEQSTKQIQYLSWVIQKAQSWIIIEEKRINTAKKILKSKNLEYKK